MTTDNLLTPENEAALSGVPEAFLPMVALEGSKPAALPEKFWDTQKRAVRLEALVNSYRELEKKLSTMNAAPQTPEDKTRLLAMLGVPASPDEYHVDCRHGMFTTDPDVNARLHQCGCTPEQVQAVYDLAAEKLLPAIQNLAAEFRADREVEKLVNAFGGPEKWQEISRQLLAYGQKNLPPDVLDNLASSYEGVMALFRMMKGGESAAPVSMRETGVSAGMSERDLRNMMRDPRYWRDRDPSFVAKVTDGFKTMYAGK